MNIRRRSWGKRFVVIATVFIVLIAITGGGIFFFHDNLGILGYKATKPSDKPRIFSFTGAPGWWQGATNETSMAIFDSNETHACFVSTEYKSGTIDVAADLQHRRETLEKNGNYTMTELDTKALKLQIPSSMEPYELHQFSVTTPKGAEKVKEGQAVGYVQLSDGYVELSGYCDLARQLKRIIAPLEAIKVRKQ